ncbi:dihydropteroate synthase [Candidatus Bipolaricaulota bacterium]|nr:dihydropteroate synthase [Candidatus Bipolaricaulota bacterium]MBS3814749.1 dihydropteroate synthase [Candidatus Bipolaricaulota bacterium]MBS3825034.1 dihydropteroate synthase [Candidatus Bipolaricaulota bacterium]
MFLTIGELINSTRDEVKQALKEKDEDLIRKLARDQAETGADVIDLNAGESMEDEQKDMDWLIDLVEDEIEDVRICIDTPDPEVLEFALEKVENKPVINSISNEADKKQAREVASGYDAEIIGLAMGEEGMPETVEDRLNETEALLKKCDKLGIDKDNLYIDVIAMTIGSNQEQGQYVIDSVSRIKEEFGVKTNIGLSNMSFGLPDRPLINRTVFAMLLEAGLDAALIDPTDKAMMDTLKAAEALLGADKNCLNYLKYKRSC